MSNDMIKITQSARIKNKIDTTDNWRKIENTFVPLKGEVIYYDDRASGGGVSYKIGDGITNLANLLIQTGNGSGSGIELENSLESNSTVKALTANQGRVLNNKILNTNSRVSTLEQNQITIDTELSNTSNNPVQNKVLNSKLNYLEGKIDNLVFEKTTLKSLHEDKKIYGLVNGERVEVEIYDTYIQKIPSDNSGFTTVIAYNGTVALRFYYDYKALPDNTVLKIDDNVITVFPANDPSNPNLYVAEYVGKVNNNIKMYSTVSRLNYDYIEFLSYGTGSSVEVIDNLESESKKSALSANQGRILNEKIENLGFSNKDIEAEDLGPSSIAQAQGGVTSASGKVINAAIAPGKSAAAFGAGSEAHGDASFAAGYGATTYQQGTAAFGASTAGDWAKHEVYWDIIKIAETEYAEDIEKNVYANAEIAAHNINNFSKCWAICETQYSTELNNANSMPESTDEEKTIKTNTINKINQKIAVLDKINALNTLENKINEFKAIKFGFSFAAGDSTEAIGRGSVAFGSATQAIGKDQFVIGMLNKPDPEKYFIIGNGATRSSRKNIFTIDRAGNVVSNNITSPTIANLDNYLYVFNSARNIETSGFRFANYTSSFEDSAVKLVVTKDDPRIEKDFSIPIDGSKYKFIKIFFKSSLSTSDCRFYFKNTDDEKILYNVQFSGERHQYNYHSEIIDLSTNENWIGKQIKQIRFDVPNTGATLNKTSTHIKYIALFETKEEAENYRVFDEEKDSFIYTFETSENVNKFLDYSTHLNISQSDDKLVGVVTQASNSDATIYHRFNTPFKGSEHQYVKVKYKTDAPKPKDCILYCLTNIGGHYNLYGSGSAATRTYTDLGNNEYIVLFDLSKESKYWNYDENNQAISIKELRFDMVPNGTPKDTTIEISYIGIFSSKEEADNYDYNPPVTIEQVEDKFAELVDSAPETLNTLKELAAALGNDENFATTVATELGNKVDKSVLDEKLSQKSQVQIIIWEEND